MMRSAAAETTKHDALCTLGNPMTPAYRTSPRGHLGARSHFPTGHIHEPADRCGAEPAEPNGKSPGHANWHAECCSWTPPAPPDDLAAAPEAGVESLLADNNPEPVGAENPVTGS